MDFCLNKAIARFIDHCRIAKRLSPNTLRAYEVDLADFAAHAGGRLAVAEVDREMLRGFARRLFDERGLKETTVKRRMAALKVMFRWLERDEVIALSPFHRLDLTIRLPHRLPRALSADEMRRLLQRSELEARTAPSERRYGTELLHFVIATLFATGLRVGELTEIRVDDIDPECASIVVRGKGNRERKVFLPGRYAVTALERYRKERSKHRMDSDHLLVSECCVPVTPQFIRRAIISLAKRADISRRVTPHMLRHTAATQLIEAGVDIRFVQKLLGHASIATTQIYTQVSDASLRATLERADTLGKVVGQSRFEVGTEGR